MKHCHISIMCNELPFLKHKLKYLYKYFSQIIFVDYNLVEKSNSTDGSIEYIENFPDPEKKIILIKDFDPNKILFYHGESFIEKQKMFAKASEFINKNTDIIWATDLDEFFDTELINEVEQMYDSDKDLISIDLPHKIFVYNQYNYFDKSDFYICPRITKYKENFIYGHCDFDKYGKTIKYTNRFLYHYAFVGLNRCYFKFNIYTNPRFNHIQWLNKYVKHLREKDKYIELPHSNTHLKLISKPYTEKHPDYLDIDSLCNELNII